MDLDNLAYFDLEATGTDPQADRIIQVAIVDVDLMFQSLVNPGRSIPATIQELTGITDAMVADAPSFADLASRVALRLTSPALVGFGCHKFDVPLLAAEFERAGVAFKWPDVIDAGELFKIFEPRSLSAATRFYCAREHTAAHGAMPDTLATRDVFLAQLKRYADLHPMTAQELAIKSRHGNQMVDPAGKLSMIDGRICFATHRNRGVPIADDEDYARWMLRADFPLATKEAIRREFERLENVAVAVARDYPETEVPF